MHDAIARMERAAEKGKAIDAAVEGVEKNWGASLTVQKLTDSLQNLLELRIMAQKRGLDLNSAAPQAQRHVGRSCVEINLMTSLGNWDLSWSLQCLPRLTSLPFWLMSSEW